MFAPFKFRNYRLYFGGQLLSLIGTWMQQAASAWLVLTISHSGTVLGLVVAAQMLPVLLLGTYGGLIADRMNKRRLMLITQTLLGLISLTTGVLALTGVIELWMIVCLSLMLGLINSIANPARQSFVSELVPREYLRRAVSTNSVIVNTSRAIGPALAAVLIATVGLEMCFFVDAGSYLFVIAALLLMNTKQLNTPEPAERGKGQIREGLSYVRSVPALMVPLMMVALIGTLAYEFQVLLPLVAKNTFHGNASTLGTLTAAQGTGAIVGGLFVIRYGRTGIRAVSFGALGFGFAMTFAALAPTYPIELLALFLVGVASVQFLSVGNSTLQLTAAPKYRGRVMALLSMAYLGSTPIGGPIIGFIAQHFSPRLGMGVGAAACFGGAAIGFVAASRIRRDVPLRSVKPMIDSGKLAEAGV